MEHLAHTHPDNDNHARNGARLVSTDGSLVPLRATHLEANAEGGIARTILTQTFVNDGASAIRVRYLVPLPADGAVSGFSFTIGEKRIVGEVDRKASARERFEQAISEGKAAAILDQERANTFTQEVGNIPAGATVLCEIVIDQPLAWLSEGAWEWRFPTVLGPRYLGAGVEDADKVTVP
ncbi:MAG: hypothetical protein KJO07_02280, partial [Deltaproteobacteria bacterium]|nr:hypothetical protein [Deltaproteobacteria bacterium]